MYCHLPLVAAVAMLSVYPFCSVTAQDRLTFVEESEELKTAREAAASAESERRRLEAELYGTRENAVRAREAQQQAEKQYQEVNSELRGSRDRVASQIEFMNNVVSYRTRTEFDQEVDRLREEWDAKYGPRIGIVNPYTNSSHYRYYDEEGENWAVSQVKGDYDGLATVRKDWQTGYRRAQQAKEKAEREYAEYAKEYGAYQAIQSQYGAARAEAERRRRLFSTAQAAESELQAGNTTDAEGTTKGGYPVAPNIPEGYRGPRWVNGMLVSP